MDPPKNFLFVILKPYDTSFYHLKRLFGFILDDFWRFRNFSDCIEPKPAPASRRIVRICQNLQKMVQKPVIRMFLGSRIHLYGLIRAGNGSKYQNLLIFDKECHFRSIFIEIWIFRPIFDQKKGYFRAQNRSIFVVFTKKTITFAWSTFDIARPKCGSSFYRKNKLYVPKKQTKFFFFQKMFEKHFFLTLRFFHFFAKKSQNCESALLRAAIHAIFGNQPKSRFSKSVKIMKFKIGQKKKSRKHFPGVSKPNWKSFRGILWHLNFWGGTLIAHLGPFYYAGKLGHIYIYKYI